MLGDRRITACTLGSRQDRFSVRSTGPFPLHASDFAKAHSVTTEVRCCLDTSASVYDTGCETQHQTLSRCPLSPSSADLRAALDRIMMTQAARANVRGNRCVGRRCLIPRRRDLQSPACSLILTRAWPRLRPMRSTAPRRRFLMSGKRESRSPQVESPFVFLVAAIGRCSFTPGRSSG